MGNFEKLSVLVIVVIIVMILVVALYTWTDDPDGPPIQSDNTAVVPNPGDSVNPWPENIFEMPGQGADPLPIQPIEEPVDDQLDNPAEDPIDQPIPAPLNGPGSEPAPVSDAPGEIWLYDVKSGDSLSKIAELHLGTWRRMKDIMDLNSGLTAESLRAGTQIKMPPKGSLVSPVRIVNNGGTPAPKPAEALGGKIVPGTWYVIEKGDRLKGIAKRAYGNFERWPELWARNLSVVADADLPTPGTKIFIPR